jgi:hypothetical protein
LYYIFICANIYENILEQSVSSVINVSRMSCFNLKEVSMESIKSDSSLSGEPSFNKMNQKDVFQVPKNPIDDLPWIVDDLAFPNGTEFRGKYKGYFYYGEVSSGALMMNGKEFLSPSAAAMTITRSSVDSWLFWDCKPPGASSWINIHTLKQIK